MIEMTNHTPLSGSPIPADRPPEGPVPGTSGPTEATVLSGANGAKMGGISLSDHATGPNGSGPSAGGTQQSAGSLFGGETVVDIADSVIPGLIVLGFALGKITVKKGDFQLSAKEKGVLSPLVQKVLDQMMINFNSPVTALCVTALAIYGTKVAEFGVKGVMDKKGTEKATKEQKQREAAAAAKVVGMDGVEVPIAPGATETIPGFETVPVLRPWGAEEVSKVMKKRKCKKETAIKWLNDYWEQKGGVL